MLQKKKRPHWGSNLKFVENSTADSPEGTESVEIILSGDENFLPLRLLFVIKFVPGLIEFKWEGA